MANGMFQRIYRRAVHRIAERAGLLTWRQGGSSGPALPLHSSLSNTEDAMQASAVSACVRLISGNVAKLPAPVYQMNGENRKRDRKHPVDVILNRRPNSWQTSLEFRKMMTARVALDGNAYALKRYEGSRLTELIPLVGTMKVTQAAFDEPPTYLFTPPGAPERQYQASEIFHLRDLTLDGVVGLSRIQQARQGITLAIAGETFATSYFINGAEPGIGITVEGNLTPDQRNELKKSWLETHGGPHRAHVPFVMEGGAKIEKLGASNKESQFIELRSFQVEDIARMYGVPPHMIGHLKPSTSYGTGIAQQALGFLQFHLLDWLVMWETAVGRDLIDATDKSFMEHTVEGLLRADFKTRMEGYQLAIQNGILNPDEVRRLENKPPRADGKGGEYWRPSNMVGAEQTVTPKMPAAVLPGDRPEHAWRTKARAAMRIVGSRDA